MPTSRICRATGIAAIVACLGAAGCSAPPRPQVDTAPTAPHESTERALVTSDSLNTPPYDVDQEGRFPPAPQVPAHAAHGWRDTMRTPPLELTPEPVPADARATPDRGSAAQPPGYRVQVAACGTREAALELQRDIQERLALAAYIEHEPPYYKVRVGNCPTQSDCRRLEARLRAEGWESAWVVRTRIVSP